MILALALAASIGAEPAPFKGGSFYTGNRMLDFCSSLALTDVQKCDGYIAAIADAMDLNPLNGFRACIPGQVAISQLRQIVNGYLLEHVEIRQQGAAGLIADAFTQAFPCPR